MYDTRATDLLAAVIALARKDAAAGDAAAAGFVAELEVIATGAKLRRRAALVEPPPPPVEPPRRELLRAELEAHGWPAHPLPRGTVPALAERLGVARNTMYCDMRAMSAAGD
jgi:hypothetical protein